MSVHLEFFHPDRIVVGVGRGNVAIEEYAKFLMDIVQAGVLHYRKIIDISSASSETMGPSDFAKFEQMLAARANQNGLVRGPLAIIISPDQQAQAQAFKAMSSKDRPVEVFYSIRDARKWLLTHPVVQPERRTQPPA
ncbi:MAG: hypothetical protein JSR90_22465 [Proteobacteria bacterium]|nr:hypothetical protein [Pseudomonadota bacterium]